MASPGYDSGLASADVVAALLAIERGWLPAEQLDALAEQLRRQRSMGRSTSLLAFLLDRGLLDEARVEELKQARAGLGSCCPACGHVTYRHRPETPEPACERCASQGPPPPPPPQPAVSDRRAVGVGALSLALIVGLPTLMLALPLVGLALLPRVLGRLQAPQATTPLAPQATAQPLLWAIEAPASRSFLYGTIHLPDPRVTALPDVVETALRASDELQGELVLDAGTRASVQAEALLPEGERVQERLPPPLRARIDQVLRRHRQPALGPPLERLRPQALAGHLGLLDYAPELTAGKPVLDQVLQDRARQEGLKVAGLETPGEQSSALAALDGVDLLWWVMDDDALAEKEGRRLCEPLLQAWLSGDLQRLAAEQAADEARAAPALRQTFRERVVLARNRVMADRIGERLAQEPRRPCFFAVGALHLTGPEGLLALLERQGLRLRRLGPEDAGGLARAR